MDAISVTVKMLIERLHGQASDIHLGSLRLNRRVVDFHHCSDRDPRIRAGSCRYALILFRDALNKCVGSRVDRSSLLLLLSLPLGAIRVCALSLRLGWRAQRAELLCDGSGLFVGLECTVGDAFALILTVLRWMAGFRVGTCVLRLLVLLVSGFLLAFVFPCLALDGRRRDLARVGVEDGHIAKAVLATG